MVWTIKLSDQAQKNLAKLDPQMRRRVLKFLYERVAVLDNPRLIGEALTGDILGEFWKYRIGDYRVIADIQDDKVCILVVRIGNRRDVYKSRN